MAYFQEKDEKQSIQQYSRAEGSSIVPQQCHRLITSMPHLTDAVIFVLKEPRPSIECINEHTLKNLNFSVLQILFFLLIDCDSSSGGRTRVVMSMYPLSHVSTCMYSHTHASI